MPNDVTDHDTADDADSHVDFCFDLRGPIDDQRAFEREDFAGDVPIDPQHVFEGEFAIEFGLRVSWPAPGALLNRERAARRSQLSGDDSVNWKRSSIPCFADDYGDSGLKAGFFAWLIDGKGNRSDS